MAKVLLRIAIIVAIVFAFIGLFVVLIYAWALLDYQGIPSVFLSTFEKFQSIIPILNIVVLSITFGAIAYYSIETNKLRKVTSEQLSYNTRPVVILKIKWDSDTNLLEPITKQNVLQFPMVAITAELKNVGEGIATNIEVAPIVTTDSQGKDISIVTGEIMPLAKTDKETVGFFTPTQDDLRSKLICGEVKHETIKIYYDDLQGNKFYTLIKLKEAGGEWSFYETGKRV